MNNDRGELLRNIFTDPCFIRISRYLKFIAIDGAKIGVVIATLNPRFFEYALNKGEEERLLTSKRNGKVSEAYTVFARVDELYQHTFSGYRDAEELHQQILAMGLRPRNGIHGEFYTLPSILTMSDDDVM
jgi:hypothetical protein